MSTNKWWGYIHTNGGIQVKRYFDKQDIIEATESPFVKMAFGPFEAVDRDDAIKHVKERYGKYK